MACLRDQVVALTTENSDKLTVAKKVCQLCKPIEIKAARKLQSSGEVFWTEQRSLEFYITGCDARVAVDVDQRSIALVQERRERTRQVIQDEFDRKIGEASVCSKAAARTYSLSTKETPTDVSTAAFAKCSDRWSATARLESLLQAVTLDSALNNLRLIWLPIGIAEAVDARADEASQKEPVKN